MFRNRLGQNSYTPIVIIHVHMYVPIISVERPTYKIVGKTMKNTGDYTCTCIVISFPRCTCMYAALLRFLARLYQYLPFGTYMYMYMYEYLSRATWESVKCILMYNFNETCVSTDLSTNNVWMLWHCSVHTMYTCTNVFSSDIVYSRDGTEW